MIWGEVSAPFWDDRPLIICGTGPSLRGFDFSRLEELGRVLAVKEAVHDLPFAAACFGLDMPWMRRRRAALARLAVPLYLAVSIEQTDQAPPLPNATFLKRRRDANELSDDSTTIEAGGNSGFGALNLAYLKRAKDIILFGFDYAGEHYCRDRYEHLPIGQNARYLPKWAGNFETTRKQLDARGISVLNASPNSNVHAFPKCTIEEAIESLKCLPSL